MSVESQLHAFEKTDKFKKLVAEKMKISPDFGTGSKELAVKYGEEMKKYLRNEILTIRNKDGEAFLDHIIVKEEFTSGVGWTVDVSFDEDEVTSNSLYWQNPKYEMGAYLPELFNDNYNADNYVYGYNNNGISICSSRSLTDKHQKTMYFIQRAVDAFNTKYKGKAVAEYNSKYTGGTL